MTDEHTFERAIWIPQEDREAFLVEACGDDLEQKERVLALLSAHERPDSLLDTDAMMPTTDTDAARPIRKTIGDFEILGELGRGGMGVVYEARQKSLKRKVALKVLSSGLGLSSKAILRFRREAEAAGKLHHTNIVPIYTTGEDKGIHYYAMELIDGPSLDAVIKDLKQETTEETETSEANADVPSWLRKTALYDATGPASDRTDDSASLSSSSTIAQGSKYFDHVASMIAEVADALDHAHEHGVIHRDIKPSNLLLAPNGRLSVNDFGLARMLEQPGMTMSGEFVGSPLYMSPEQITAGRVTIDHRTDIYSLGATLYELLALQPPFPGETRDQVLGQILQKDAVPPRKFNRKVPTDLDTICMKAIDKDPDRRYQTAGQLADDLRKYINRHAISARRIGVIGKSLRWISRHPSQTCLAALVLLALAAAVFNYRSKQRRELEMAQQMHLICCLGGDFDSATEQMNRAAKLGADIGWLRLAEGQTELYRGNFQRAFGLLDQAAREKGPNVPTDAMRAIAHLFRGDEREHALDLQYLTTAIERGDLIPKSPQDHLYLAMAFMYADPHKSLMFLSSANQSGDLHELVRSNAYRYAADFELDIEKALEYAKSAQFATHAMSNLFPRSPLAAGSGIEAETIASICFERAGDQDGARQARESAREYAQMAGRLPSNEFQMSMYLLLDETEVDHDKVTAYLRDIPADQIDYYTQTYRMIDCIRTGDIDQVMLDLKTIDRDRDFKHPFVALTQLSSSASDSQRQTIRKEFGQRLRSALAADERDVFHIEFFWAAAKLLGMREEVDLCERAIELRAAAYDGFYVGRTMQAIVDVTRHKSSNSLGESAHDRRDLTYMLFATGVESLANGDNGSAKNHFDACSREGIPGFYVCQFARAISAKLVVDPTWPN